MADQTQRNSMETGATVAKVCRLGSVTMSNAQNATFNVTDQGGTIALSAMADRNTARALPATISVTFDSVCNQSLFIRLVSANGGLKQEQGAQGGNGFINRVDYSADLGWAGGQANLTTTGGTNESTIVPLSGAQSGPVTLNITIPAGSQPLVAGDYADVLTVEFAGQL